MIKNFAAWSVLTIMLMLCAGVNNFGQPGSGQSEAGKGDKKKDTSKPATGKLPTTGGKQPPKTTPGKNNTPPITRRQPPKQTTSNPTAETKNDCAESEILIHCDAPECSVAVDGRAQGEANLNGELQVAVSPGKRSIAVSKNGYETAQLSVNVSCGELERIPVKLKSKPYNLQIKTNPANCDIFVNSDQPVSIGKSDEQGLFEFRVQSGTVYIQARKEGYLTDGLSVSPTMAGKEIALKLKPLPARIVLQTNVSDAFAQADDDEKKFDLSEPFSMEAGQRKLTVQALGHSPQVLELNLQPNRKIERAIRLERLPIAELLAQAEAFLNKESYRETIRLCDYVFESEPDNAPANRLMGTIYLLKKDYGKAETYLQKALAGDETIRLKIRRHANEKFELSTGHGAACDALLILNKTEIEYRGLSVTTENFKTPYSQIQILGLQIKKDVALYLSAKVTGAKNSKKDYNFYGRDKELSQNEKPYLEMIQKLIQKRK